MAKDDFFKIVYALLTELYACKKEGCKVNPQDISPERFGINEGYLLDILAELLNEGYIKGILMRKTKGTGSYCVGGLEDIDITMKGIEYLQDNSMMNKVRNILQELKNLIPGI
ncbi:MAG: hypothetical protein IJW83_02870 [Clostridia bacterium]|nr:hypothetical protein [Clostridia bacterium]